jgi:hypothetical protein
MFRGPRQGNSYYRLNPPPQTISSILFQNTQVIRDSLSCVGLCLFKYASIIRPIIYKMDEFEPEMGFETGFVVILVNEIYDELGFSWGWNFAVDS